ncbi:MAG: NAD(+)/NADH kinase [Sulfolobales archaeon]|nr:NAD(+)/NADH kinase [Sulfolobales archaeon]MCX8186934.1 NAD(+)/NADH kinase [Sulfolobales archaeon]MDW7968809.1 NAD(+)/NADH kinase [Sulfolobales archaeon]
MLKLGLVAKLDDERAIRIAREVINYCISLGIEVFVDERLLSFVGRGFRGFRLGSTSVDYIVVVGGDGTVLTTLQGLGDGVVPLITIKSGKRGFLCDVSPEGFKEAFSKLVRGDFVVREYMRLESYLGGVKLPYALNEYVLTTSGLFRSKVAHFKVFKSCLGSPELIYEVLSDGVIVSTTTGSTAYNLSVGGPLVDPDLDAFILTPLAPLSLGVRPLVLSPTSEVVVEVVKESYDVDVIADGNYVGKVKAGDSLAFRRASVPAKFVRFSKCGFDRLFQRLMYEL